MSPPTSIDTLRADIERHVQESLEAMVAGVRSDVVATPARLTGAPAEQLSERSAGLDLLVLGWRGYGEQSVGASSFSTLARIASANVPQASRVMT